MAGTRDKQTLILVGGIIGVFAVAMLLAAYASSRDASPSSGLSSTQKKFRAKPGTMRENARALVSSAPDPEPTAASTKAPEERTPVEAWGSLEPDGSESSKTLESIRTTHEALTEGTPEDGIKRLQTELADTTDDGRSRLLLMAMGTLHARSDPPDFESMRESFAAALEKAKTPDERMMIRHAEVNAYFQHRNYEAIVRTIELTDFAETTPSVHQSEMRMILGISYESLGQPKKAVDAFETLLSDAKKWDGVTPVGIANVCRQAGMRLHRIYKAMNKPEEAERVKQLTKRVTAD